LRVLENKMHAPVWRSTGAAHPVADYDTRYPFSSRRAWPKFGGREKDEGRRGEERERTDRQGGRGERLSREEEREAGSVPSAQQPR